MATIVHVKGISYQTTEKEVRDFFSFCGKISSLEIKPERSDAESPQEAKVTFEKETAAKTALLLDNTMLGAAEVHVTADGAPSSSTTSSSTGTGSGSGAGASTGSGTKAAGTTEDHHSSDIAQEDKPRSRIVAEYLASGYVLSDKAIESALSLDQQHGISAKFSAALQQFDQRTKATENAQAVDQKYGITARAQEGWKGLSSYFEQAIGTPTGQRVRAFYEQGQKQALDVHNEARHLADLKTGKINSKDGKPSAEQAGMEKVEIDGKPRTHCNCGGADGSCPCEPGKCACSGCGKAGEKAY